MTTPYKGAVKPSSVNKHKRDTRSQISFRVSDELRNAISSYQITDPDFNLTQLLVSELNKRFLPNAANKIGQTKRTPIGKAKSPELKTQPLVSKIRGMYLDISDCPHCGESHMRLSLNAAPTEKTGELSTNQIAFAVCPKTLKSIKVTHSNFSSRT